MPQSYPSFALEFPLSQDFLPPAVTLHVTQTFTTFAVTWSITDPLLDGNVPGAGLAAYTVQVCPDSPTTCTNLVPNPNPSGTITFQGDADHAYTFRVWAKDRVDNETTAESGPYGTASVTKYYLFGGQRIAMRQGGAVYYLHGDHLGSVSMTTGADGTLVSQARYTPFGELHWESGAALTDFGFTGQRAERGLGLVDYNARFYVASVGRFVSADTIVPNISPLTVNVNDDISRLHFFDQFEPNALAQSSVINLDRFSFTQNNPLLYVDPTGHRSIIAEIVVAVGIFIVGGITGAIADANRRHESNTQGCQASLSECFGRKELKDFDYSGQEVDSDEFSDFLEAVYTDISSQPRTSVDYARMTYDTPFHTGNAASDQSNPDLYLCVGDRCDPQSAINYVAQGMYAAAAGESLNTAYSIAEAWNQWQYEHGVTEAEKYWIEYGYKYYLEQKKKDAE